MNIEKTISEQAVSDILTPMLESQDRIVTEDVAPLFEQATGLDTPPASGTVTTTIEESRSVITAIIRKAWTATLTMLGGASVLSYIAAAYTYLRNRLQGNETYGIPDRRSEISASSPLAANLALLNDRKIGGADVPDGMSLVRILADSSVAVTELTDDTHGWTMNRSLPNIFQGLERLTLRCKKATTSTGIPSSTRYVNFPEMEDFDSGVLAVCDGRDGVSFPKLKHIRSGGQNTNTINISHQKVLHMPELVNVEIIGNTTFCTGDEFEEILWENFVGYGPRTWGGWPTLIGGCPNLKKVVFGKLIYSLRQNNADSSILSLGSNCIRLEIGEGTAISLMLNTWNPTNALDASRTDLIEEGSTAANNLEQFLENFRDYIANRLTDNGSGKTLTLSQAVFSEIWDSQGQPQVKGDGLDELRADIHRIIRTDKKWAVNKA